MKLAAIYNVWDGEELLKGSMMRLKDHVDLFIIVHQKESNFGEWYEQFPSIEHICLNGEFKLVELYEYQPRVGMGGAFNEKAKRNMGLDIARSAGCTHFIHMDCDEYYEDFGEAKQLYINSGHKGSVCKLYTYFGEPTLRFENPDGYYVPFIHELRPDTKAGDTKYPFYCDPTRRINETDIVELPVFMHHYSWVRNNIERKCRNSSAKSNIEKGTMLKDYYSKELGPGYYVKDYKQRLIEVENIFGIDFKSPIISVQMNHPTIGVLSFYGKGKPTHDN